MSKSGCSKFSEIVGLAAIGTLSIGLYWAMFYDMGLQSGHHRERAKIEREHHRTDAEKHIQEVCAVKSGTGRDVCIAQTIAAERDSQRSESDLAAQWQAADWALWATIIAGIQLIATVVGLYFVKRTLDATFSAVEDTSRATDEMRKANLIAERSQRPWIDITAQIDDFSVVEGDSIKVKARANITNIGASIAESIQIRQAIFHSGVGNSTGKIDGLRSRWQKSLDDIESVMTPKGNHFVIYETRMKTSTWNWSVEYGDTKGLVEFLFIVGVFYKIPHDETWRYMIRTFSIGLKEAGDFENMLFPSNYKESITAADICLNPYGPVWAN